MSWLLIMRCDLLRLASLLLLALASGPSGRGYLTAQEPSASLKQADADYRDGVAALNRGDLNTAQSKFEDVVRLAPAAEQGHSALGAVLVREGQMGSGIRELQKALLMRPGDESAQMNLALAYEQTGEPAKALPLFQRLEASARLEKHPPPAQLLAAYARALAATGQSALAIARMKEAVGQNPRDPQMHDDLGSLYAQRQDWEPAEQEFNAAIGLNAQFAAPHLHLGFALQAEQKAGASDEWMKAYNLAPEDANITLAVGKALAEQGQDEQAALILEQAMRLEPHSTKAAYQLGMVLQRVNRVQDAIPLLKGVVEAEPKNIDALINLGLALTQAHQARDAVPYLQRAIALKPENTTAHQDLAATYLQVNEVDDAIAELRSALKLSPDSSQLHYNLGVAYKLKDDAADAIPELQAAEKFDSAAYEPPYLLGVLYMQMGRYEEAAPPLEASLKLHAENADGWATLGNVCNKLERLPEAVSALREAIRQSPNQADSHLTLAAVLVKQNQPGEAAAERKIAANLMRAHMNLQRAQVATNSGKSLMEGGNIDDAVVQFRDALTFDPDYVEAHLELAKALEKQGKTAEADHERELAKTVAQPD